MSLDYSKVGACVGALKLGQEKESNYTSTVASIPLLSAVERDIAFQPLFKPHSENLIYIDLKKVSDRFSAEIGNMPLFTVGLGSVHHAVKHK